MQSSNPLEFGAEPGADVTLQGATAADIAEQHLERDLHLSHEPDVLARREHFVGGSASILRGWEAAEPVERKYMLDQVGRLALETWGVPAPEAIDLDMPARQLGAYRDDTFEMKFNRELLNDETPRRALETYLHEYRHAVQHLEDTSTNSSVSADWNASRSLAIRANINEYHSPPTDAVPADVERHEFTAYASQFRERDAEGFAEPLAKMVLERRAQLMHSEGEAPYPRGPADAVALAWLRAGRR